MKTAEQFGTKLAVLSAQRQYNRMVKLINLRDFEMYNEGLRGASRIVGHYSEDLAANICSEYGKRHILNCKRHILLCVEQSTLENFLLIQEANKK